MNRKTKTALYLLTLAFTVYSFFQFPGFQGYEDETYKRIVTNIESSEFKTGRSGYAQTVLETPFVLKGQFFDSWLNTSNHQISQLYALLYNPFVTAVGVAVMFMLFNLFVSRRKAFWLSLVYAFGTMAFPYAGIGMEPTAVLFVLLATYFLFRFGKNQNDVIPAPCLPAGRKAGIQTYKYLILSGLFYFLLFFSKAYYFVMLPAFLGYLWMLCDLKITKKLIKNSILFFSSLVLILPLYLFANNYNFGNYFGGQYNLANELTGGENIIFGTYGLLLSFGKSIFIYVPALILSVAFFKRFYQKFKNEAIFVILYSLLLILFVAQIHWWSDETWGPRYLLSLGAIGLIPLVSISQAKKALINVILFFTFAFQLLGVSARYDVFPYTFYEIYGKTGYNILASQEYQYIPQFAPYFVNYQLLKNKILGRNEPINYNVIYSPPMELAGKERGHELIKEITYDNNKYQAHVLNFWWSNIPIISAGKIFAFYLILFLGLTIWGRNVLKFKKE